MIEWIVSASDPGFILNFLARKIPTAPAGYLRQLIRKGKVLRNQTPLTEDTELSPGDRIVLKETARLREILEAAPQPVDILYESREILIAYKPAGLATHRGKGHEDDHLQGRVLALMQARKAAFSIAPVNRLDLDTSGPVLFGKGRRAISRLGQLFMDGEVRKLYLALVSGKIRGHGLLTSPVSAKGKLKNAATSYRTLASDRELSLLELELHSGRTHQIRQQLAAVGLPLVGDQRYGGALPPGLERMFLHCQKLSMKNPFDEMPIIANCALPEDLTGFLRRYHPKLNIFPD